MTLYFIILMAVSSLDYKLLEHKNYLSPYIVHTKGSCYERSSQKNAWHDGL